MHGWGQRVTGLITDGTHPWMEPPCTGIILPQVACITSLIRSFIRSDIPGDRTYNAVIQDCSILAKP